MEKDTWRKYANTVMLTVIMLVVSIGVPMLLNTFAKMYEKLDTLMITVTVHNSESEIWKGQIVKNVEAIEDLQNGQHDSTRDRITKTEALKAVEDLKIWVDKYYARK